MSATTGRQYYLVEPAVATPLADREPCPTTIDAGRPSSTPSDALALLYADCVKGMLRARAKMARVARLTSNGFAVLTAATAAVLGAAAIAPLTAVAALAAASAVTPPFMRVFGADERPRAYEEGLHLIEAAEARYWMDRAGRAPVTPPQEATADGARLYVVVVSSLKIVEDLLVARLSSVDDILRAQGRIPRSGRVTLSQSTSTPTVPASGASRDVVYTVTATNGDVSAISVAVLELEVVGAKGGPTAVTSTGPRVACHPPAAGVVRCTITSLAANDAVAVTFTATAPDATSTRQRMFFTSEMWEEPTKLPLSGPPTPVVVTVDGR